MEERGNLDLDRSTADAWKDFQRRLGDHIADMADDDIVLIEVEAEATEGDDGCAPYVQFCAWHDGVVRGEASSNRYLAANARLDEAGVGALVAMGWQPPTRGQGDPPGSGSANFHVDAGRREADRLAAMAVAAFRDVWGVPHPAFLTGDLDHEATGSGASSGAPAAGASCSVPGDGGAVGVMPESPDHLRRLVDQALVPVLGEVPRHDDEGDISIRCGSTVVFVRVHEEAPLVELFAVLVYGVPDVARADAQIARLNRDRPLYRFVRRGDQVWAQVFLPAIPFVADQLRSTLTVVSQQMDDLDDDLVAVLGGRRACEPKAGPRPSRSRRCADETTTQTTHELAIMIELDALDEGSVTPDVAARICRHDSALVLRFIRESSEQEIAWRQACEQADAAGDEDEADVCQQERSAWGGTVQTLRRALRLIVHQQLRQAS
ncbi:MAG: hypothetical protein M3P83_11205 [Actinomycetota bacterium]|nr:hypothetical protein [Actinomycetota bacterium]